MTCPLDRLLTLPVLIPAVLAPFLHRSRMIPKQDQAEQPNLTVQAPPTCPAKQLCTVVTNFGPFGSDFWAQAAPTWAPGLVKIALPLESGIEIHNSRFFAKNHKT